MVLSDLDGMESESALPNFIDPKKFRSMKVTVVLKNFTLTQNSKPHFELLEMETHTVTLDTPDGFCTQGHNILLGINIPDHPHFIATAKVTSVESINIIRARVQVSLIQYDKKSWLEIQSAFSSRQEMINQLMLETRGC
jgi:hypothetical protein